MDYITIGHNNLLYSGLISVPVLILAVYRLLSHSHSINSQRLLQLCSSIQFIHIFIAFICLIYGFFCSNFSLKIIALNSQRELSLFYKFAAIWSNHQGSMMLWILTSSCFNMLYTIQVRKIYHQIFQTASIIQIILIGVLSITLYVFSNPFEQLNQNLVKGLGLNPLLHDPAMLIHPPTLYFGLVGFTIPFALAVSALIHNQTNFTLVYLNLIQVWILFTFSSLTAGIMLGSIWAYYELGWGGYWYWDPVETISLIPWLMALVLIHMFKSSNDVPSQRLKILIMTISLYCIVFLGTYLSRSGIIASVHAFAFDPNNGIIFLVLSIITAIVVCFFSCRNFHKFTLSLSFSMMTPNLLKWKTIVIIAYCVVLITSLIIPSIISVFFRKNIIIQPNFYIVITSLVTLVISFMMPLIYYAANQHHNKFSKLIIRINYIFGSFIILAFACALILNKIISILMACILISGILIALKSIHQIQSHQWQVSIAHGCFALLLIGISINYLGGYHQEFALALNKSYKLRNCTLKLMKVDYDQTALYKREQAVFHLNIHDLRFKAKDIILRPEKRLYHANQMLTTKTALHQNGLSYYYLALGGVYPDGKRAVFFGYYPMILLIWIGGFILSLLTLYQAYLCGRHFKKLQNN